jgi:hypothetical protein
MKNGKNLTANILDQIPTMIKGGLEALFPFLDPILTPPQMPCCIKI